MQDQFQKYTFILKEQIIENFLFTIEEKQYEIVYQMIAGKSSEAFKKSLHLYGTIRQYFSLIP